MVNLPILNISNFKRDIYIFTRNERGVQEIQKENSFFPFFWEKTNQKTSTYSYDGIPLRKVIVSEPKEVTKSRSANSYSSDIKFPVNYLIHKIDSITKAPIKYCFLDIECLCKDLPEANSALHPISCISIYNSFTKEIKTWYLGDYTKDSIYNEDKMLEDFVSYVHKEKFDLILIWNLKFDYNYLCGRVKDLAKKISPINMQRLGIEKDICYPAGVSIVDYLSWFRKVFMREGSYALDFIAQKRLGRTKKYSNKDIDFSKLNDTIKLRNCFDKETEIMTKEGFKYFKDLIKEDLVLSMNPKTKEADFYPIKEIISYKYNGEIFNYEETSLNFSVTPNHNMLVCNKHKRGKIFKKIEDLTQKRGYFKIPKTFIWKGIEEKDFILPQIMFKTGWNYRKVIRKDIKIPMNLWLEFLGWYISEGWIDKNTVGIAQSCKSKHYKSIEELIKKMGFNFFKNERQFVIYSKQLREWLNNNCYQQIPHKSYNKKIPEFIKELSPPLIKEFLTSYRYGDAYITSSKKLADDILELILKMGWCGKIKMHSPCGKVFIKDHCANFTKSTYKIYCSEEQHFNNHTIFPQKLKKYKYNDMVYCVNVEPFHTLLVRRKNNNAMWCANCDDISIMCELEEKYQIIPYFDEIRRLAKVQWEDLIYNSRVIEMLLFTEAKKQNIILPNKPKQDDVEEGTFEGATRDLSAPGLYENVGEFDLASAYPQMIVNFCLDSKNIKPTKEENCIEINGIYFKQDPNTLLPLVVKPLLVNKDILKKQVKENPNDKTLAIKYDAIKGMVNSSFGVCGLPYFRLFNLYVASSITFLVRDLLMYVKEKIELEGLRVIYYDTDSCFINTKENIVDKLNQYIKDWALEKYGKSDILLNFDWKGYFDKLFLLGICHYYGILHGKKEPILKGIEGKRSSSSRYEAYFQLELLNQVVNNKTNIEVEKWVQGELERIKILPLEEISFPCKIRASEYKNIPVFKRALDSTQKINKKFKVSKGEQFFYIYMNNKEVLAFTSENKDFIDRNKINWVQMIERSIFVKTQKVFNAMKWNFQKNSSQLELI